MGFLDKPQTQKKRDNLGKIPLFCYPFYIMRSKKKSGKKSGQVFHCKKCDYTSRDKYDWNRHLSTRKHKMDNMDNSKDKKKWVTIVWSADGYTFMQVDSVNTNGNVPFQVMLCEQKRHL